ncbi:MAG: Rod shape-determining protein MreC [uncultured Lysobacter sp.]|uniref:Cell shape-determining protein MreC n=1 Tax=uncultured Lysobacter sp. TaxID=271060 RepID=A0A6J4KVT7_9GAMM|nr:MAG: Rod shape-determining protein MreC [uncultured Lysobacter sp.]
MAYLALSLVLIVLDHRGGWVHQARQQATVLVQPLWAIAGWPARMTGRLVEDAGTLAQLTRENRELRQQALLDRARMARMRTVAADNARLRELLDAAQRDRVDAQLAPILDVDLDPTRQRLVLDAGRRDGVRVGQSVIDAGGLLGQVMQVTPLHSSVLLVTDPDHAVPVVVARNGVRLVVYGRGRSDLLALESVPLSSDVKVGDAVVTSGLGGRFPPGLAVGRITALRPDDSRAFLVGDVRPAAQLDRGRDVLLLRSAPPAVVDTAALAAIPPSAAGLPVALPQTAAPATAPTLATPRAPVPAAQAASTPATPDIRRSRPVNAQPAPTRSVPSSPAATSARPAQRPPAAAPAPSMSPAPVPATSHDRAAEPAPPVPAPEPPATNGEGG